MIINTDYYGSVEYTPEELVTFPEGVFGFPHLKQYLPLGLDDGDGSLLLLQSVEDPEIAFFLINPPAVLAAIIILFYSLKNYLSFRQKTAMICLIIPSVLYTAIIWKIRLI